jgi:probable rRNA maturation factor
MPDKETFSITNTTKSKIPSVPFALIKEKVLGKKYNLSLVFIGEKKSQKLNNSYRGKNKPTNCLSFSLDKNSGEIFITPKKAKREAKLFDRNFDSFIGFLFIHSLLHLKGFDHGSTMERAEEKLQKQFQCES